MTSIRTIFVPSCGWAALATSVFLIVPGTEAGVTITARTVSFTDVSSAIALASEGDTVVVPPGTGNWTSGLTITKGITLRGATTVDTSTTLGTFNDQTIIVDNGTTSAQTMAITLTPNQVFRMTGFTFRRGTNTTGGGQAGVILGGICPGASGTGSFRIDHCHFDHLLRNVYVQVGGWLYGVIDHCVFYASGMAINVHHEKWGTYSGNPYGDGSWADLPYFGSKKFVFIEDNCITNATTNGSGSGIDAKNGARMVIRYNHLNNALTSNHGTEGQRPRGGRVIEFYNNTVNYTFDFPTGSNFRSGTGVVHHNAYTGLCHGIGNAQAYRTWNDFGPPYGKATGTNNWDSNSNGAVLIALDQPGRGKGNLVTGDNPTPTWPNNALEPIYVWANTVQNPNYAGLGAMAPIMQGRDVYNNTPMPGYTPYTYPHPLVSEAPEPPANLRVDPVP
jgi:hypothetical protein